MKFGHKKMYIDGQLLDAKQGKVYEVICPADEQAVAQISWAGKEDTEQALRAAQKGFAYWSKTSLQERATWMHKLREKLLENQDLLRSCIMHEMGKVWEGTEEDMTSITDSLQYYAEEIQKKRDISIPDKDGTHTHKVVHQPLGVVAAFLSYNFPLLNLGFKLGPALAAGCSIIIKPSEYAPLSAYFIGEMCHEIGFPAGVINILCGNVAEVGLPLCESTIPRLITLIGSTQTAQKLIQQSSKSSLKRYSMECGGNAPFIVFEDADLQAAIDLGAALKIGNSGQICVAPNRFYLQEPVRERFVEGLVQKFEKVKVGFGRENRPDMGPLANRQSVEKVKDIIKEALEQGGKLIYGGNSLDRPGYYVEPTIIQLENPKAAVLQKEIFGPVVMIVPFASQEEVIEWSNSTHAGLASYVFSQDEDKLKFFADQLEFGEVQMNGVKYDIYLPHGGIKNSGVGVDCSPYALDDYLIKKRVSTALA